MLVGGLPTSSHTHDLAALVAAEQRPAVAPAQPADRQHRHGGSLDGRPGTAIVQSARPIRLPPRSEPTTGAFAEVNRARSGVGFMAQMLAQQLVPAALPQTAAESATIAAAYRRAGTLVPLQPQIPDLWPPLPSLSAVDLSV